MVEVRFVLGKLPLRAVLREVSGAGAWDVTVFHDETNGALVASATWDAEQMRVGPWNPETWSLGGDDYRRRGDQGDVLHRLVQAQLMNAVIAAHVSSHRRRFGLPHGGEVHRGGGLLDRARGAVMRLRSPRG